MDSAAIVVQKDGPNLTNSLLKGAPGVERGVGWVGVITGCVRGNSLQTFTITIDAELEYYDATVVQLENTS